MAKEKSRLDVKSNDEATSVPRKLSLEVDMSDEVELVVCEVCGHKNAKNAGICAMCSNYLFD